MKNLNFKRFAALVFIAIVGPLNKSFSQGAIGIDAASSELTTYVDPIGSMILIIGALVGLIGGVRVYIKWNSGDQDVNKTVMGWFASCLFLVTVGVVINAFFGL